MWSYSRITSVNVCYPTYFLENSPSFQKQSKKQRISLTDRASSRTTLEVFCWPWSRDWWWIMRLMQRTKEKTSCSRLNGRLSLPSFCHRRLGVTTFYHDVKFPFFNRFCMIYRWRWRKQSSIVHTGDFSQVSGAYIVKIVDSSHGCRLRLNSE